MSTHIPRLNKRAIVGVVITVALAIGCGVAFATSPTRGTYDSRLHMVVPNEKAQQIEHALAPARSGDPVRASVRAKDSAESDTPTSAPAPPLAFDRIPGRMISTDTPVPVSPELIDVQNGWMVSDGKTLVAVYAGAAGNDPGKGRFVIVRQDLAAGSQTIDVVDVPGAGAVAVTDAPTGAAIETAAQRDRIGFHGLHGWKGDLDLADDSANRR